MALIDSILVDAAPVSKNNLRSYLAEREVLPFVDPETFLASSVPTIGLAGSFAATREGVTWEIVASGTGHFDHPVTGAGLRILPKNGGIPFEGWGGVPKSRDPDFDNAPIFARILAYLNAQSDTGVERNIDFESEVYQTSALGQLSVSHVTFRGRGTGRGSFGDGSRQAGAQIQFTGTGIGLDVRNAPASYIYNFGLRNIRISGTGRDDGQTLVKMSGASEWVFENVTLGDADTALELSSCGIGPMSGINLAACKTWIKFTNDTDYAPFIGVNDLWIDRFNFWDASESGIVFDTSYCRSVVFRSGWCERAAHMIEVAHSADANSVIERVAFKDVTFRSDNTYGAADREGLILRVSGNASYTTRTTRTADWVFEDCMFSCSGGASGSMFATAKGGASGATYSERLSIVRPAFGPLGTTAFIKSDESNTSVFVEDGPALPGGASWTSGTIRISRRAQNFGRWDYSAARATILPQIAPDSLTADGQFWWRAANNTLAVSVGGATRHIPPIAAGSTAMTTGFALAPAAAGAPAGTPAGHPSNLAPFYVDTTNNELCIYYGGGWKKVALS